MINFYKNPYRCVILVNAIAVLLFITACGSSSNKYHEDILEEFTGKKIIVLDTLPFYGKNGSFDAHDTSWKNSVKMIGMIDGACGVCVDKIYKWQSIAKKLEEYTNLKIILFVRDPYEIYAAVEESAELYDYDGPIVYDSKNLFAEINSIPADVLFHGLLLDEDDKVLLIGDPTNGESLQNLYFKTLETRL